jgi:hypothetical protein
VKLQGLAGAICQKAKRKKVSLYYSCEQGFFYNKKLKKSIYLESNSLQGQRYIISDRYMYLYI